MSFLEDLALFAVAAVVDELSRIATRHIVDKMSTKGVDSLKPGHYYVDKDGSVHEMVPIEAVEDDKKGEEDAPK